jgi:hypothetical protein
VNPGETTPGLSWQDWLEEQRSAPVTVGTHHSPLDQRDVERMNQLIDALQHIRCQADAAGLPLPRRLQAWGDWAIPVGRLSFPTGPAVTRLLVPAAYAADAVTGHRPGQGALSRLTRRPRQRSNAARSAPSSRPSVVASTRPCGGPTHAR